MKKTALTLLLISCTVHGQETRPYHFSGPCTSQGVWTQAALNNTERLRQITRQLRDDENCKAVSRSFQASLVDIEAEIKNASTTDSTATSLATLPQEITALRSFMSNSPAGAVPQNNIMGLMMSKALQLSMVQAQVQAQSASPTGKELNSSQINTSLLTLGQRVSESTKRGLKLFNDTIDSLPKVNECLLSPNQTGPLLGSVINVLSSFASSGQDATGVQLAKAVEKLMSYSQREVRFSEVMRNLNNTEFLSSMACIMEVTSESYCSARDGQMLFTNNMNELQVLSNDGQNFELQGKVPAGRAVTNPITGYYVLTQHVPNITNWLQKIQIGVTPNLKTDADFQKGVLDLVNDFFKKVKDLEANYNQKMNFLKSIPSLEAKQSFVLDLLISTVSIFSDSGFGPRGGSDDVNFFKMAVGQPRELPFRLLDMEVPVEVRGQGGGSIQGTLQNPEEYLQNNYRRLPQFQNPDALAESIGKKLFEQYIIEAKNHAIAYYNRFFIVDKVGIVNSSLVGMNFNVRDSFIAIDRYLTLLDEKLSGLEQTEEIIPAIRETRSRVGKIIARYNNLSTLSKKAKENQISSETELNALVVEANAKLITEVYDQLEVMLAKTGWLANRMVDFVYKDYSTMIQNKEDLSPYYKELFYATGLVSVKQMVDMAGSNPANVQQDLAMAMRLSKENIDSLERLLSDSVAQQIGKLYLIKSGKKVTTGALMKEAMVRSYKDGYEQNPGEDRSKLYRTLRGTLNHAAAMLFGVNSDRYNLPGGAEGGWTQFKEGVKSFFDNGTVVTSGDDEFGSAQKLQAQLCTQILSFKDLRPFWSRCKDTELVSPYPVPAMSADKKTQFDDYLSSKFKKIAWQNINNPALNHSNRICAFRDFNRRNLVLWLTQGMRNNQKYTTQYTTTKSDDTKPAAPMAPPPTGQSPAGESK